MSVSGSFPWDFPLRTRSSHRTHTKDTSIRVGGGRMAAAAEDEWTFVSNSKSRRRRRNPSEPRRHKSKGGGFCASPNNKARAGTRDTQCERDDSAAATYDKGQIQSDIIRCLDSFEEQIKCGNGFAHRLVSALATASRRSSTTRPDGVGGQSAESSPSLREVVAYGIGNFATGRFQSPMLQLACALLLRRMAASTFDWKEPTANEQKQMLDCDGRDATDASSVFRSEQDLVQLYYFDPCMLPVEKEMLETTFHVHVLDSNDMGKLSIEVMRSQIRLGGTHPSIETQSGCFPTLFYMPHCPMRLYSNVLWSHWKQLFPSCKCTKSSGVASATEIDADGDFRPILIFGNSFSAYEDRTISSKDLSDPTNGVFKVVPHSRETRVACRAKDEIVPEALRHIEMAFSDSNVISFCPGGQKHEENGAEDGMRPGRPKEWTSNDDPELNGR